MSSFFPALLSLALAIGTSGSFASSPPVVPPDSAAKDKPFGPPLTAAETRKAKHSMAMAVARPQETKAQIAKYTAIVRANPRDEDAWYRLGLAKRAAGDNEAAARSLQQACALAPGSAHNWRALAFARAAQIKGLDGVEKLRKGMAAVDAAQKAVVLDPNDAYTWFLLGSIHYTFQQFAEARNSYEKAGRLLPGAGAVPGVLDDISFHEKHDRGGSKMLAGKAGQIEAGLTLYTRLHGKPPVRVADLAPEVLKALSGDPADSWDLLRDSNGASVYIVLRPNADSGSIRPAICAELGGVQTSVRATLEGQGQCVADPRRKAETRYVYGLAGANPRLKCAAIAAYAKSQGLKWGCAEKLG